MSGEAQIAPKWILPQLLRHIQRLYPLRFPPALLIRIAVQLPMVEAAKRDGELIADLLRHGGGLCEPQMVSVRRFAIADQTGCEAT